MVAASPASGVTTIGATSPTPISCGTVSTVLQTSTPDGSYTVPENGVITRWSTYASGTVAGATKLKVGSGTTIVGESAPVTLVPNELNTFTTRVPVSAGNVLGLFSSDGSNCAFAAAPEFSIGANLGDVPPGGFVPNGNGPGAKVNVVAAIQRDLDGDGYGDETQDLCPSNAALQTVCDSGAPETTFKRKPKRRITSKKARFRFRSSEAGSTFECKLDESPFAPCQARAVFKVSLGRHVLRVRAIGPGGVMDPIPARARFRVIAR